MRKLLLLPTVFFLSTFFSTSSIAATKARIKCLVKPPQAEAIPVKTNWRGVVRWRVSVAGKGVWQERPFEVAPDGFMVHEFIRPNKRGIELQAVITVYGGWAYESSSLNLYWDGGQKEPDVSGNSRCEVERNGVYGDVVEYGAIFRMKRIVKNVQRGWKNPTIAMTSPEAQSRYEMRSGGLLSAMLWI